MPKIYLYHHKVQLHQETVKLYKEIQFYFYLCNISNILHILIYPINNKNNYKVIT